MKWITAENENVKFMDDFESIFSRVVPHFETLDRRRFIAAFYEWADPQTTCAPGKQYSLDMLEKCVELLESGKPLPFDFGEK